MKRFLLFLLFISSAGFINAQTISLSSQTALPCQTVNFPVTASGLPTNIGSVELQIHIDTTVIGFTGHTPGTMSSGLLTNRVKDTVKVVWTNTSTQNLNGTMLTLHFTYYGGSCLLEFTDKCEIASGIEPYDVIPVNYINGSIGPEPTKTFYVDAAAGPAGDGLSWGTALQKISGAANKPLTAGDHVLIKPGTYNDTVIVKSNGKEIVPLSFDVSVSETNKITFPSTANLSCVDPVSYPGRFYAYLYRSWKGNNGAYKIISVNKDMKYVIVEGASFVPESGAVGDSSLLQAAIGMPIVYEKYAADPENERVIINPGSVTGERAALHIGKIISSGDFDVDPANYNIIDGIDITAADNYGVRIQNSKFNVYRNSRLYELESVAFLISGNLSKPANNNFILKNTIYNSSGKAVRVGIQELGPQSNHANLNHIKNNEIFSSGSGSPNINYVNAIEVCQYTGYTVIEKNTVRDFKLKNTGRGAVEIRNNVRRVLAYSNYLKNVDRIGIGTHAAFYLQPLGNNNNVYNNVIVDSAALDNDVFAFWIDVNGGYTGGAVVYNTVHNVDNGFKLVNTGSNVAFAIKNNIMNLEPTTPVHFDLTGPGLFNVSYNCYSTLVPDGQYTGETGRIIGDPSFWVPTYYQWPNGFSLTSGSICLNTGNPVSGIVTDYFGVSRHNTSPSRGAFENISEDVYWTGAFSTNWHYHLNWNPGLVPTNLLQAIIPVRQNLPVISDANAACKGLKVEEGASIQIINNRSLTVY